METGMLIKSAPFGTSMTPTVRMKIVGGKQVYVREKTGFGKQLSLDSTGQQSDKNSPTSQQTLESHISPRFNSNPNTEPPMNTEAQVWNSHSVVPPISPRKSSDPLSAASAADYYKNNSHSSVTPAQRSLIAPSNMSAESPQDLWSSSKGQSYFPSEPIILNKTQELGLLNSLAQSLQQYDVEILKHIYNELSVADRNLTGWVPFADLEAALQRTKVYLSTDDLRMTASMYVSPQQPGMVNYEKLLSFIAAAQKRGKEKRSTYFEPDDEVLKSMSIDTRPNRPSGELAGAQGKLMRMVQAQLALGDGPVDLDKLRNAFTESDRLHRNTLSHGEIKEICYRMRVPLQESIINHILDRCQTLGDGQYKWSDFIDFLEKVQPSSTGLPIPDSKRPTEYAKKFPQPNPSWPKTNFEASEAPSTFKHNQTRPPPQTYASAPPSSVRSLGNGASHSQVKMTSDGVQTDEDLLPGSKSDDDPWFARFTKLAEAMYRSDLDRKGHIKYQDCSWLVNEYNNIYALNFNKQFIEECIQKNTSVNGTDINGVLRGLMSAGN